jgi:hypothetical protein
MKNVVKMGSRVLALLVVSMALCGTASAGAAPPSCPPVPEIDPGSAVGAMTLLVGGLMSLADKHRSR